MSNLLVILVGVDKSVKSRCDKKAIGFVILDCTQSSSGFATNKEYMYRRDPAFCPFRRSTEMTFPIELAPLIMLCVKAARKREEEVVLEVGSNCQFMEGLFAKRLLKDRLPLHFRIIDP